MKKISFPDMMNALFELKANGLRTTLLGIGVISPEIICAGFELSKEKDFPLIFIASRNQVDIEEFGGGYVLDWNQKAFSRIVDAYALKTRYCGLYFKCRDHGGPWQRDNEKAMKLSEEEAMRLAMKSYIADLKSGFDLLHIDPTIDPRDNRIVPMDKVIDRTIQLIKFIERERRKCSLPEIGYEVGTEETSGCLTTVESYEIFINELLYQLDRDAIPKPNFIVGQTGTLTRLTRNVGNFNAKHAATLADIAKKYNVGLKEHNSDYLQDLILLEHPILGITAANIAPEFGTVQTKSYLELSKLEIRQYKEGRLSKTSNFLDVFINNSVKSRKWKKWMVGDKKDIEVDSILKDRKYAEFLTVICGHYLFNNTDVKSEKTRMMNNLNSIGINAEGYVIDSLKAAIWRYVRCFNLEGLNDKILEVISQKQITF